MIKKGDIIKLEIENFAFGGKGIGKIKEEDRDFIQGVQDSIEEGWRWEKDDRGNK